MVPWCFAPVDATHPNGNPSKEYYQYVALREERHVLTEPFSCHSGDVLFAFGTFGQFSVPYRDELDLPYSQFVVDHWAAFARTYDPNPDLALLRARNYTATIAQLAQTKQWAPVSASDPRVRVFAVPARMEPFPEQKQCAFLQLPLDFYEH